MIKLMEGDLGSLCGPSEFTLCWTGTRFQDWWKIAKIISPPEDERGDGVVFGRLLRCVARGEKDVIFSHVPAS